MNLYMKKLEVDFNHSDLDCIKKTLDQFHDQYRSYLLSVYNPGNTIHTPNIGYYIPIFDVTHKDRNVSSWKEFNEVGNEHLSVMTVSMQISKHHVHNLYVVKPYADFNKEFYNALNRVLDLIPINFQRESSTATIQEFGYSMKFHVDSGVKARIHINLVKNSLDYFYVGDDHYKMEYGECYFFEASKINHGFMSFHDTPRMHLIMDII
jgi:hypothetical protein